MGTDATRGDRGRGDAGWRRASAVVLTAVCIVVASAGEATGAVSPELTGQTSTTVPGAPPRSGQGASSSLPGPTPAWGWPLVPRPAVLHGFDPPDVAWGSGHRGVDLAAAVGQPLLAPTAGVVSFSGVVVDRAVVVLTTPTGLRLSFEPVAEGPAVGTAVVRGETLGRVSDAAGHCAPSTCLHWGARRDDTYLDPLALVGVRRVVLLPLLREPPP